MNIEEYKKQVKKANDFVQAVENNEMYFQNNISYNCIIYIRINNIIDIDTKTNKVKCEFTLLEDLTDTTTNYNYSSKVVDTLDLSVLTPISRDKFDKEVNYFKQSI